MKTFVSDLKSGSGVIKSYFAVTRKESRVASNKKPFISLGLADKTGEVKAIQWDTATVAVEIEDVVQVMASVEAYQDKPQLIIQKIRAAKPAEYDLADFLPASERPPEEMLVELEAILTTHCSDRIRPLLFLAIREWRDGLLRAPASKAYHHAYIGGLLHHNLGLARAAVLTAVLYKELDLDVLLAGCLFHDIGKISELSSGLGFRYTRAGKMFGHVAMGYSGVREFLERVEAPKPFTEAVLHLILSHHGALEHGAAVLPQTREALAFHILDLLDSRMAAVSAAEKLPGEEEGLTAYIPMLKTAFFRSTPCPNSNETPSPAPQPPQAAPAPEARPIPPPPPPDPKSAQQPLHQAMPGDYPD